MCALLAAAEYLGSTFLVSLPGLRSLGTLRVGLELKPQASEAPSSVAMERWIVSAQSVRRFAQQLLRRKTKVQ